MLTFLTGAAQGLAYGAALAVLAHWARQAWRSRGERDPR